MGFPVVLTSKTVIDRAQLCLKKTVQVGWQLLRHMTHSCSAAQQLAPSNCQAGCSVTSCLGGSCCFHEALVPAARCAHHRGAASGGVKKAEVDDSVLMTLNDCIATHACCSSCGTCSSKHLSASQLQARIWLLAGHSALE